ncbi:class I SAM-dependent methyltransferase [Conexibacter woesei]|uniref:class I SAM-dependent methyltransferase n=1 Tax=Conexibacter woesei TaxID=191495 RepID=UPI0004018E48|nr:class I SAM-dependent methyltransferase [Conexibacter woesei]
MSDQGNPDFTTHNYADFDVDEGFEPEMYDAMIRKGIPAYDRLQREVAALVTGRQGLELGTGLGATTLQAWHANDFAQILCIDMAENMLADAAARLSDLPVRFLQQRLEDPLPAGPFDTVFSALAVHHLDGPAKADLFVRVAAVLNPGGRFVLGDLVVPEDPADVVTHIDGEWDRPSTLAEQVRWMQDAGLTTRVAWAEKDLAVIVGEKA